MSNYVLDIVFVIGVLTIMLTTIQKNQKIHLRRAFCALIAFAGVFFVLSYKVDGFKYYLEKLDLGRFVSILPAMLETDLVRLLGGCFALLVVAYVVYLILLFIVKLFSKDRRKFKKDSSYAIVWNPFGAFVAGLLKSVLFVYVTALFAFILKDQLAILGLNIDNSIIYPILESKGIIIWADELKSLAQLILK